MAARGLERAPLADWLDEAWRYDLQVPAGARFVPGVPSIVDSKTLTLIGRYHLEQPAAELSVWGMMLNREVDVADWVKHLPMMEGKVTAPAEPLRRPGAEADLEVAWEERHSRRAGRLYATRRGRRLFVLLGATTPRALTELDAFSPTVASFVPKKKSEQPFAEGLQFFRSETPMPWKVALPASWVLLPSGESDAASGFQAKNMLARPKARGSVVGQLAFAVAAGDAARTPAQAAKWYLDELAWSGLSFEAPTPEKFTPRRPFRAAWRAQAEVTVDGYQGELRYAVLYHRKAWVVAGVVGVTSAEDPTSWMQNKRAIDILVRSVSLTP